VLKAHDAFTISVETAKKKKLLYLVRFTSSYASHPPGYENILKCKTKRWLFNEDAREYRSSNPDLNWLTAFRQK